MQRLEEFLFAALARGDRLYLYSESERRILPLDEAIRREQGQTAPPQETGPDDRLTERENQILAMVKEGLNYRAIADALFVTVGTVKKTVHNALRKIGVHSRWDLFFRH